MEDGLDAVIEAAGEAAEGGGGLDNEVGVRGGERGGDGGDGAELDVGELFGPVSDDVILDLSDCFEFHVGIGGGKALQDWIRGRERHGGGCGRRWHRGGGRWRRRWRKLV